MRRLSRAPWHTDTGDASVIAVILLVAVALLLSSAVYLWAGHFLDDEAATEHPSVWVTGLDLDDDNDAEWVRVSLVRSQLAGFHPEQVLVSVTYPDGATLSGGPATAILCNAAQSAAGTPPLCGAAANNFHDAASPNELWDRGEALFVPCMGTIGDSGLHHVTVAVSSQVASVDEVDCRDAAS